MPADITPFSNSEFELEIKPDGADSFRVFAPGLARALSVTDAYTLLRSIPDEEKGSALVRTPGGEQRVGYVTEAGFYRALATRQLGRIVDPDIRASVERFQAWVYRDVLPALRRDRAPEPKPTELSRRELAQMVIDESDRADQAEEQKSILEATLEAATPAIAYHERYVSEDDVLTVKAWAAQFGMTDPQARDLLVAKHIIYRHPIGRRWSDKHQRVVDEFEYRARAGRATFGWFDLRPQHNAPRHHNNQVRQTLYVRQQYALDLARKVGAAQRSSGQLVMPEDAA